MARYPYDPEIYINYDGEHYYVGQSKHSSRGSHGTGDLVVSFPAPDDRFDRRIIETEMIQFCKAAGLPLSNVQQLEQPVMGFELDEEYR